MITNNDHMNLQQSTQDIRDSSNEASDSANRVKDSLDKLKDMFRETGKAIKTDFTNAITDAIKGGDSFSTAFTKVRQTLEDLAIKAAVVNPLSNLLFGGQEGTLGVLKSKSDVLPAPGTGGLLGDLTNSIADLFGARAFGGPVSAGQPYLVGERGPELFVPQASGSIQPNASGGSVNITMHISTNDAASFQASQTQIAASMMDAARRAQRIR